jgi:MinD superfamily P-loop ATPase
MEKIVVTGGKGGVGKSTVAVLLANEKVKEGKRVVLCDCDVECPNDYLLTEQKLNKEKDKVYFDFPKLIKSKCNKCGLCVKTCRENAIFQAPGQYPVFLKDLCSACGACQAVCPFNAIVPEKEEVAKIFSNKINENFFLVTGLSKVGIEEGGPIVTRTKEFALKLAEEIKADFIFFDTAPGIHCSVISALKDCDKAFCVADPSPMSRIDLKLILELCKKMEIPPEVVLNQADLSDSSEIEKMISKFNTKIVKRINYSSRLVELYSKGRLLEF